MHVRDPPLRGACFVPRFSLKREGSRYSLVGERKLRGGFMEIIVTDGVSIKIDDEAIVSWAYDEKVGLIVQLKNGLGMKYLPFSGNLFFTDICE